MSGRTGCRQLRQDLAFLYACRCKRPVDISARGWGHAYESSPFLVSGRNPNKRLVERHESKHQPSPLRGAQCLGGKRLHDVTLHQMIWGEC